LLASSEPQSNWAFAWCDNVRIFHMGKSAILIWTFKLQHSKKNMRIQITRLSPHQNAKVFGILMAVCSLIFAIQMAFSLWLLPQPVDAAVNTIGTSMFVLLLFPIIYLVMSYAMVWVACSIYNRAFRHIGGIEFDQHTDGA